MRIASSLEYISSDRRATARPGGTASFAELLEAGTQARTVLSHRALGFSEAGLLGVHFAHEVGDPRPHTGAAGAATGQDATNLDRLAEPEATPPIGAPPSGRVVALHEATAISQQPNGVLLARSSPSKTQPAMSAVPRLTAAPEGSDAPLPQDGRPGRTLPPSPSPARRRSPFHVRLSGDGSELVVIVEGHLSGDESILELEATARAVASEYCMGISHLFVRPNRSIATA